MKALSTSRLATHWVARLGLLCAATGVVVTGLTQVRLETSLHSFLPSSDASITTYDGFSREYGGDPVVVLLETETEAGAFEAEALEALVRLEGTLAGTEDAAAVYGPGTLLNQVAGRAQDLLAELAGRRDAEIALAEATAKRKGASPSGVTEAGNAARDKFDARYGPLIVQGLPGGAPTLRNPRFVERVVFDASGLVRPQWRFAVPSRNAVTILVRPAFGISQAEAVDLVDAVRKTVAELKPAGSKESVSGGPVLVAEMSDAAVRDVPVLGLVVVGLVALVLASVVWVRRSRRWAPIAITLASMSATLSLLGWLDRPVSLGVVAFATVLLGIGCYYPSYFTVGASVRTVVVVAVATATSLATMTLSPIPMVQDLGLALGLGVILACLFSFPLRSWLREPAMVETRTVRQHRWAQPLLGLVAVVAGVGWLHLGDLDVRSDVTEFAGGLAAYDEAEHVADVLGSSGELAIILRGADALTPEGLAWLQAAEDTTARLHGDRLRRIISAPELLRFLGPEPTASEIDAAMRILPEYLTRAVVTPDRSSAMISFGVRIEDLETLRAVRDDLLSELPPTPAGYEADVTGLPTVLMRGEDLIVDERLPANVLGILVAAGVLALGLRRRSDAARALAAGAIATGLGFFLLWATGTHLNPITAALGALTAAVGCEFTVVLAEAVRERRASLLRAVQVATAMSAAGYAVLVLSDLGAVRSLGIILAGTVGLALVASWLVVQATIRPRPEASAPAPAKATAREVQHV